MNHFYAAFIESSYRTEGDERSRTNPGHGYPAETVNYTAVVEFLSKEKMEEWVRREEKSGYGKKKYKIVECIPMSVETTISVVTTIERKPT